MRKPWQRSSDPVRPVAFAVFAALLLPSPPAVAAPRTHTIVIGAMKFGPMPQGVRAGDRILWVNKDMFRHTATAKDRSFDVDLPPGTRKSSIVRKAGEIAVICRYHPGMRMMLKVKP
ncbi:MAG TPA: cupredoxin domain-containing protein [Sphingomicrobium sp.]|nr:cupredoxin domain-containing protein [Sphingomicrobium sp.]